jgi:hypothetical protein
MEYASVLESIAEVGIGLAGFGGLAAGLGYRARGTWSPQDQFRLIMLASSALAVVFACFLPYVTHHLGSTAPWRMASALFLPFPTLSLLYVLWRARRVALAGYSRIAGSLGIIFLIGASALLFATALGYADPREFGFYLSAILLMLLYASLFFFRLLITSFRSSEPAA